MSEAVLDATALLAVLRKEPGREQVESVLTGAAVSAVNYAEMITKSVELGGMAHETRALLRVMDLVIVPFDEWQAVEAAALSGKTKANGLSFADRACLTLGMMRNRPVYTTNRRFAELGLPVEVRVIRPVSRRSAAS